MQAGKISWTQYQTGNYFSSMYSTGKAIRNSHIPRSGEKYPFGLARKFSRFEDVSMGSIEEIQPVDTSLNPEAPGAAQMDIFQPILV